MNWRQITRRTLPLVAGAVVGLGASLAISSALPQTYEASSRLFLGSPASADSAGAYNGDLFSQQRAATYAQLVSSRDLAVKVVDDLGLSVSPDTLATQVTGAQVPKTVLMEISATDSSAQGAANLADAYADNLVAYIARLETPTDSNQPSSVVTVVQKAEVASSPVSPNYVLNALLGLAAGILVAMLAMWLVHKLDRTVRSEDQLADATGVPVLGTLPRDTARLKAPMDNTADAATPYAEAIRRLRTNFLYSERDSNAATVAFTSPRSAKSTTATMTNLAIALDSIDHRPVIIDAGLRESRVAQYLGDNSDKGLSEVLSGDVAIEDAVYQLPQTDVRVVFAGSPRGASSDLLASKEMTKTLGSLAQSFDHIFLDTPGVLDATDAAVVGLACDEVVLVAIAGKTRIDELAQAKDALSNVGVRVVGAVLAEAR
ncbi:Wzz/FepE/Etk N-terminal domain-containing protein [Mycobacterium sp. 2YAF39]|uniref:Wzz/FepE/Etk N-terminal domain-containing protein n=1 Tax=Mycobacterium sp. 2YAF39 TaxID=3233033 RepID=UPI003F979D2F